jgi:Rrf2 family protein
MFSKTCTSAIKACIYLAQNNTGSEKSGAKTIATSLALPEPFMAKILQQLVRFGVVSSSKGPNGGFHLTEAQLQTPLMRVVELFDGLYIFEKCILDLPKCSSDQPCPLHPYYNQLKTDLSQKLSEMSVAVSASLPALISHNGKMNGEN